MMRPRAEQRPPNLEPRWRHLIIDGYVDEPAALGVPPYISPHVRSLAGGLVAGGTEPDDVGYLTIDQWRGLGGARWSARGLPHLETAVLLAGCIVPGKYLRGTPVSLREAAELASSIGDIDLVVCGPAADQFRTIDATVVEGDPGVLGERLASCGAASSRVRTLEEWDLHLRMGAFIIRLHPDFPSPLIAEIETTSGCPRYITGGCSFCIEPKKGPMVMREPQAIEHEVSLLSSFGLENLRVGGQSDLVSYGSEEIGRSEVPTPDPGRVNELMVGVHRALYSGDGLKRATEAGRRPGLDTGIVHTDNANPAVIARHPELSRLVLSIIAANVTPGSVLALGLESADPEVGSRNNLNSTPEEALEAISMVAGVGGHRGENGMPQLLAGINFLGGLPGQTEESFELDLKFLMEVMDLDLPIRRLNIRAARFLDGKGRSKDLLGELGLGAAFRAFKERVRSDLDPKFLGKVLPEGTVLKGVFAEASLGRTSFGRQIGSYPVLVGMEHQVDCGTFLDVVVTEVSSRSVTGFRTPFSLGSVSFSDLQSVPGIGRKRAASIFRHPPKDRTELASRLEGVPAWVLGHLLL